MQTRRILAALVPIALAAAACTATLDGEAEGPDDTTPDAIAIPDVDTTKSAVPIRDVVFDTFDGGSLPLSEATSEQIRDLLDRIPPLDDPAYDAADADDVGAYLGDGDLVVGYVDDKGRAYAFPFKVLNFHEIVNDTLAGRPVLISYCPLCQSAIVYDRRLEFEGRHELEFSNTSALYESDLVMVDRETGTYWWQVAGRGIVGSLTGAELEPLPSTTSTWGVWKQQHPETRVLSRSTGFTRPYHRDPFLGYADRIDDGRFPFPVSDAATADDRLTPGTPVLGVEADDVRVVVPLDALGTAATPIGVGSTDAVVFSEADESGSVVYAGAFGSGGRTFTPQPDAGRPAFVDTNGSVWDTRGRAIAGPEAGAELTALPTRTALWFAYVASFPDATLIQP